MATAALTPSRALALVTPAARALAAAGTAGLLVGVPAGLLSRAIMKISAVAAGSVVVGVHTSNGNVVGAFTPDGTLVLVIVAGVIPAVAAALLYVAVRPWLLRAGSWRGVALGAYGLALTGFSVLEPGNNDFVRFGPPALNVAMFAALFIAVGLAVAPVTDAALRVARDPSPGQRAILWIGLVLAALVATGLVAASLPAWEARMRGEHFGGSDAAALLTLSAALAILAQRARAARPFALPTLAVVLGGGIWITGRAIEVLLTISL